MFSSYKIEGIIIKRSNFGEADKILTIFARDYGKMKTLAMGVRKINSRRAPHIELFNYSRITLHRGRNFDIVTEAEVIRTFSLLKKDVKKVAASYYLAELVDRLCPEHQEHNDILSKMASSLASLNDPAFENTESLMNNFSLFILTKLGFIPRNWAFKDRDLHNFIENLIERKLKTVELLTKINN